MKCPTCNEHAEREQHPHKYVEGGLDNVVIHDMEFLVCTGCDVAYPLLRNVLELDKAVARKLLDVSMDGDAAHFLRKHVGLKPAELAYILTNRGTPVTRAEVNLYENGKKEIPESYQNALKIFVEPRVRDAFGDYHIEIMRT